MKPTDVFTPAARPSHTYVDRASLNLEVKLLEAIQTTGLIISVTGPSKSGKTVLCETVIGSHALFLISGGGIKQEADFWNRIRSKLAMPIEVSMTTEQTHTSELEAKGEIAAGVPVLGEAVVL